MLAGTTRELLANYIIRTINNGPVKLFLVIYKLSWNNPLARLLALTKLRGCGIEYNTGSVISCNSPCIVKFTSGWGEENVSKEWRTNAPN